MSKSVLLRWSTAFALTLVAVGIAYLWIDRPVATFAHAHLAPYRAFAWASRLPEPFAVIASALVVTMGIRGLAARPLSRLQVSALLWGISVLVTNVLKNQLKFAFGRTWPETWVANNPSFIRDGAFGFQPFHGGPGFESFPSGHMATACAAVAVLWFAFPRWRWLWALVAVVEAVALIGANYHFVSDVIAGGFLGASVGYVAVMIWSRQRA